MKKSAWIIALVALVFIGDRVGGLVFESLTKKSQFRYSRIYKGDVNAEVLFVGNSRGLMFYQPHIEDVTGLGTLNVSYNSLPIDLANAIVQDYFDNNELPKVMVVDVTMCDRTDTSLISNFSPYRTFSTRIEHLIQETSLKNYYAGKVSHLFLYNSEIFQRALYYLNKSDKDWLLDREMNQNLVDLVQEEQDYSISTDEYLLDNLTEMVTVAQQKGIEVKLVVNPYFPPFAEKITNLNEFIQKIEQKTNLKVHNYAIAFNEVKGFGDYQHLNKYGSKKYLDLLINDGILPDGKDQLSQFIGE